MKTKRIIAFLIVAAMVFTLTGCGADKPVDSTTPGDDADNPYAEKVELTMFF